MNKSVPMSQNSILADGDMVMMLAMPQHDKNRHKGPYEHNGSALPPSITTLASSNDNAVMPSQDDQDESKSPPSSFLFSSLIANPVVSLASNALSAVWPFDASTSVKNAPDTTSASSNALAVTASGKNAIVLGKEKKKSKTFIGWFSRVMERFGADAGKTFSDQLKEPLTQMSDAIARSPVFRTGEVLVVHSVDIDLPKLKRTLFYVGAFFTWLRFMHLFMGRWSARSSERKLALTGKDKTVSPKASMVDVSTRRKVSPTTL